MAAMVSSVTSRGAGRPGMSAVVMTMARGTELKTATSSFFFNLTDNSDQLDPEPGATTTTLGGYTVFGRITSGLDVVERVAEAGAGGVSSGSTDGKPTTPISIEQVTVQ